MTGCGVFSATACGLSWFRPWLFWRWPGPVRGGGGDLLHTRLSGVRHRPGRLSTVCPAFLFAGVNIFSSALFTALSDGRTSAIISFARTFGFLLLGLLLLPRLLEVDGVWLAVPLAELLSCLLSVWFLRRKRADFGFGGGDLPRHGGRGGGRI